MSLDRNRENQRRSRARRKEYIASLESRLRQHELDGVRASAELQAAARVVNEENKLLRKLLARCSGITSEVIDDYLQHKCGASSMGIYPSASSKDRHTEEGRGSISYEIQNHPLEALIAYEKPPSKAHAPESAPHVMDFLQPKPPRAVDETECEEAAQIIANIRGTHCVEEVRPELGCSSAQSCSIKNSQLFEIIDNS